MTHAKHEPHVRTEAGRRRLARLAGHARRLAGATLLVAACSAGAADLPEPSGRVLLTVDGNIGVTNGDGVARFDRAMLTDLGRHRIETELPWTDGAVVFEGVPLSAVLEAVDADGEMLRATALNDYAVDIPVSDVTDYRVILAMTRDGERLSVRDKGPLWVIYPMQAHDELEGELYLNRHIWQLARITVEQ